MTSILINEEAEDSFDITVQDPQSAMKQLIDQGKERGFISMTELKKKSSGKTVHAGKVGRTK